MVERIEPLLLTIAGLFGSPSNKITSHPPNLNVLTVNEKFNFILLVPKKGVAIFLSVLTFI